MQKSLLAAAALLAALLLGGCATQSPPGGSPGRHQVTAFSAARPGDGLPGGWRPLVATGLRKPTNYTLVEEGGVTVVRGDADSASSVLIEPVDIDLAAAPRLRWSWKVPAAIPGADSTRRAGEDAPARVIVSFDGDRASLPFDVRMFFTNVRLLTGVEPPYAALEYVWGAGAEREAVVINSWNPRIRMILLQGSPDQVGGWITETRDVAADFRRAFGEAPGRITAVAVGTDTDATGTRATGYFGDIRFLPDPVASAMERPASHP